MKKLFDNVNKLQLVEYKTPKGDTKFICNGLISGDDEQVAFPQSIYLDGSVEQYLKKIEASMRSTLKELLIKTNRNLMKCELDQREKWMESHPGQLCIITSELLYTLETTRILEICTALGNKKPLKSMKKREKKVGSVSF
jgi:dynein heavy chain